MARSTVPIASDRSSVTRFFNVPIKMTMQDEIKKAANTLHTIRLFEFTLPQK
jgi:hypothetical protein